MHCLLIFSSFQFSAYMYIRVDFRCIKMCSCQGRIFAFSNFLNFFKFFRINNPRQVGMETFPPVNILSLYFVPNKSLHYERHNTKPQLIHKQKHSFDRKPLGVYFVLTQHECLTMLQELPHYECHSVAYTYIKYNVSKNVSRTASL